MKINFFGDFNIYGIRILERFYSLERLYVEVFFEKKWIKIVFEKIFFEKEVIYVLLDRWNLENSYFVFYNNYRIIL